MNNPTYALEANGITVAFGKKVILEIPSFQVYPNEVLTVMGPNGSGKTTLLLCLALLLKPTSGTISYHGIPVTNRVDKLQMRRKLAVVFQESLLVNNSVWENVTLGLRLRGIAGHEMNIRTQKWLERFGIYPLARRQAKTLSGGEAKRVSLARAFVLKPEVLFLDEPFAALDTPTRQSLLEDFRNVLHETKITSVMVTHDRDEALVLADRLAVMINGHIRQTGLPGEVFSSPADEDVAVFNEVGNVFSGFISADNDRQTTVDISGNQVHLISDLVVGSNVTIYIHSKDIMVLPMSEKTGASINNQLHGKLTRIFPVGLQLKLTLDCGIILSAMTTQQNLEGFGLKEGQEIVASFPASSVHLIPNQKHNVCTG